MPKSRSKHPPPPKLPAWRPLAEDQEKAKLLQQIGEMFDAFGLRMLYLFCLTSQLEGELAEAASSELCNDSLKLSLSDTMASLTDEVCSQIKPSPARLSVLAERFDPEDSNDEPEAVESASS